MLSHVGLMEQMRNPESGVHMVASVLAWLGKAVAHIIEVIGYGMP